MNDHRLVQDLHAAISRRNWNAVEEAANKIRDNREIKWPTAPLSTDASACPDSGFLRSSLNQSNALTPDASAGAGDGITGKHFVLRKNGYFYRPHAAGYTANISEAGRFTLEEANAHTANCKEVTSHLEGQFDEPTPPSAGDGGTKIIDPVMSNGLRGLAKIAKEQHASQLSSPSAGDGEPVAWLKRLKGTECKPDGRCYDILFCNPNDKSYEPLYAHPIPAEGLQDSQRLDLFNAHPGWELSCSYDEADGPWQIYNVTGGRNDREWTKVGQGSTPREAIDNAAATLSPTKATGAES